MDTRTHCKAVIPTRPQPRRSTAILSLHVAALCCSSTNILQHVQKTFFRSNKKPCWVSRRVYAAYAKAGQWAGHTRASCKECRKEAILCRVHPALFLFLSCSSGKLCVPLVDTSGTVSSTLLIVPLNMYSVGYISTRNGIRTYTCVYTSNDCSRLSSTRQARHTHVHGTFPLITTQHNIRTPPLCLREKQSKPET